MSKSPVQLRVVASSDHDFARENLARAFRDSMIEHLRAHTDGTNVNPTTLLTTDYLNHFNEIIMLLEILPSAPSSFASAVAEWEHESYEEHFEHSGFRDKELAIAGYRHAPEEVRRAFDSSVADMEQEMVMLLQQVQKKIDEGDTEGLTLLCSEATPRLQDLIQVTAGIVNGSASGDSDTEDGKGKPSEHTDTQSAVDALFE